jgi:hypothetical protein
MSLLTDETTGLETLQRAILKVLHDNLNSELITTEAIWAPKDVAWATQMNQVYKEISLEPIADANFFSGHKPSLINRGPEYFPSVTALAHNSRQGGDTQIDQAYGLADIVAVETLVKAGFYPDEDISGVGEDIVNARIQRTTDAIISVMAHNRTLGGIINNISDTPTVQISEVFAVSDERTGRWYWQASRIDFTIYRISAVY